MSDWSIHVSIQDAAGARHETTLTLAGHFDAASAVLYAVHRALVKFNLEAVAVVEVAVTASRT